MPRERRILTVGVVVAQLRSTDFVAPRQHRHALRHEHRQQKIAALSEPEFLNRRIVGGTFDAAVPAHVVVVAVAILFAVGLVVLLLVGHKIRQRESVVRRHEIDAGVRLTA